MDRFPETTDAVMTGMDLLAGAACLFQAPLHTVALPPEIDAAGGFRKCRAKSSPKMRRFVNL